MEEARAAFREGRFADAAALFDRAARSEPSHALAAHNNRAAALLELHRFSEAADAAASAVELDGSSVKALYRHARALHGMGDDAAARLVCDRALLLSPCNAQLQELHASCSEPSGGRRAAPVAGASQPVPALGPPASPDRAADPGAQASSTAAHAAREVALEAASAEHDTMCEVEADDASSRGEYGQAVAWYTHAIRAAEAAADGAAGVAASGDASLLARRGAALLHLGRYGAAASDCERSAVLDASLVAPRVTAAAALMQLGLMARAADIAAEAEAVARGAAARRAEEMAALPVAELMERLRRARLGLAKPGSRGRSNCGEGDARALDKRELAVMVEAAERRDAARGCGAGRSGGVPPGGSSHLGPGTVFTPDGEACFTPNRDLAKRDERVYFELAHRPVVDFVSLASAASAEVAALADRLAEVEAMLASGSFREVVEHAGWLMREYPLHRPLRQLKIDALISLGEIGAAVAEVDRLLLEVDDDALDLRHAEARLLFLARGVEPARGACARVEGVEAAARGARVEGDTGGGHVFVQPTPAAHAGATGIVAVPAPPPVSPDSPTGRCAELLLFLDAATRLRSAAHAELDGGRPSAAVAAAADALAIVSESAAASAPLHVLMAAALSRLGRHVEAIAVCDRGLASPGDLSSPPGVYSWATERERLLLRRAGCFLTLNQPARALADYRSAAAHSPGSAQAAAGVCRAWEALQAQAGAEGGDLYAALGVERHATDDQIRRAFRGLALRYHPDKTAALSEHARLEGSARFALAHDAFERLRTPDLRAAYDATIDG